MANIDFDTTRNRHLVAFTIKKFGGSLSYYQLFKVLFFAEKKHLKEYGSRFFNDDFYALPHGPVPTSLYDEVKHLKDGNRYENNSIPSEVVYEENNILRLTSEESLDMDFISESEIECIEASVKENKSLDFGALKDKSHGSAWEKRKDLKNKKIEDLDIAEEDNFDEALIIYIKSRQEHLNAIY